MCIRDRLTDRVDRAEDVADVGEREDLGPLGQQTVQRGQVELATGGEVDPAQLRAGSSGQLLPRDEVGTVSYTHLDVYKRQRLDSGSTCVGILLSEQTLR